MATPEEDAIAKELNQQLRSIRAAPRHSEKAASLERDFIRRLIELVSCPYSSVKTLVARNLPDRITSSEDFEEDTINAVYDLCEDLDSHIRKEGYIAITKVSAQLKKYVKRNADVLVQLLQSDEPDEVKVVELQLVKHLDMNPTVTLNVLCDQVVPIEEDMDEEGQAVRDRLRSLVIEFMKGRAKQNIIRHATVAPEDPIVNLLFDRIADSIPRLPPSDSDSLVKDILLALPGTGPGSAWAKKLLLDILQATETTLKNESQNPGDNLLTQTRHLMSLASYIALEKSLVSAAEIVRFWCPDRILAATADNLDESFRLFVFDHILRAYDCIPPKSLKAEVSAQDRKGLLDACVPLFSRAIETRVDAQRSWSACRGLLKASKTHTTDMGWKIPPSLASSLQVVQAAAKEEVVAAEGDAKTLLEEVQDLTLSLLELSKGTIASSSKQGNKSNGGPVHIKRERQLQTQVSPIRREPTSVIVARAKASPKNEPFGAPRPRRDQQRSQPHPRQNNTGPTGAQDRFSTRKMLAPEPSAPTLLSRLALSDGSKRESIITKTIPAKRSVESDDQAPRRPNNPTAPSVLPPGGFSIKGAAIRQQSEGPGSLLDRLVSGGDAEGGRNRRKRPKI